MPGVFGCSPASPPDPIPALPTPPSISCLNALAAGAALFSGRGKGGFYLFGRFFNFFGFLGDWKEKLGLPQKSEEKGKTEEGARSARVAFFASLHPLLTFYFIFL